MNRVRTAAARWRGMLPGMVDEDESPLSRALRALGARVAPRLDGYDFQLDGVAGHFILGEEEEDQDGPFTVCRMPLPKGGPVFVMDLRPQTKDELSAVARGDAIDVQVGDGAFDRTFVIEAAPSHIVRVLLDDQIRSALLSLAPCRLASAAGYVSLTKWGTCTESELVARIVGVCADFAKAVERLPEELVRQRQSAGYRGEGTIVPPEDEARATEELAAVEGVRRTRRQIAGANVGLIALLVIVAAMMYQMCTHG